jgi:hypothetical protein
MAGLLHCQYLLSEALPYYRHVVEIKEQVIALQIDR